MVTNPNNFLGDHKNNYQIRRTEYKGKKTVHGQIIRI